MRQAYLKAGIDYIHPQGSLVRLLDRIVPAVSKAEIHRVIKEALSDPDLLRTRELKNQTHGTLSDKEMVLLHSLVLLLEPNIVLETGVAHGSSSVALLSALHKIKKGVVHSIDLPMIEREGEIRPMGDNCSVRKEETTILPEYDQVGWLVPNRLRRQWHLHLGDSLKLLPNVLEQVGTVDLFLHDSLHQYSHMRKEFELIWPYLSESGILLADDIFAFKHSAIADFGNLVGRRFMNYFSMGIICKNHRNVIHRLGD
jgi:predicted O-methyltransferase YrrM